MIGDFVFGYYYISQMMRYIECITRAKHDINAQVSGVVCEKKCYCSAWLLCGWFSKVIICLTFLCACKCHPMCYLSHNGITRAIVYYVVISVDSNHRHGKNLMSHNWLSQFQKLFRNLLVPLGYVYRKSQNSEPVVYMFQRWCNTNSIIIEKNLTLHSDSNYSQWFTHQSLPPWIYI